MSFTFSNSYLALGAEFSQQSLPTPVEKPELLLWNKPLADSLGFNFSVQEDSNLLAQYFSGNQLFDNSKPIAQAYSGHQFAHFNPQLGDGRAHLLGDVTDSEGLVWDIQLKGSGTSHFSRRGDGRCALGPALREFIMSEAMLALGVPTTRCLAVVATNEPVYRQTPLPGAVVTRVASSHIRVGTFQFFAARRDLDLLKKLTKYSIARHFPKITSSANEELSSQQVLDFYGAILNKQVKLVISWLRVGFIHGVMNTDNTAISGETIDYGPCAMMNHYDSETVFSSIDRYGRYAFGKQREIMQWNMARLADCLLPLVDEDDDIALSKVQPLLKQFADDLQYEYYAMMANKLGINELSQGDVELIDDLLVILESKKLDYTQSFVTLAQNLNEESVENVLTTTLKEKQNSPLSGETADDWSLWIARWYARIDDDIEGAKTLMAKTNPVVIPRNHHVEAILASTQATGDLTTLQDFLTVLQQPYEHVNNTAAYQDAPNDGDENYHTFCGT